MTTRTETIDLTPTWSEMGEIYIGLAESGEIKAIRGLREDARKAFAMASAMVIMSQDWDAAQKERFHLLCKQSRRQGA